MIYFVGAGSGAPDLITVRGQRLLQQADVIVYAGSLVNPLLLEEKKPECMVYNSAEMTLEEIAEVMIQAEPCLYGAVREQMDLLEQEQIPYEYCPGVSSFCGAAAALNLEYTLPDVSQSVIITRMAGRTPVPEKEEIASLAAHQATMVVFLSAGMLEKLQERFLEGGYQKHTPAAIVYKATWEEEEAYVCTVGTLAQTAKEHGISKTALIIVGDVVTHNSYRRSDLYHPEFETEFRRRKSEKEKEKL